MTNAPEERKKAQIRTVLLHAAPIIIVVEFLFFATEFFASGRRNGR